ncbi:MAG: cytochrome c oxidase subunit II [Pseudomonadota bacterium]|nr:cytochrome c oxidase subunit II [Pseudomonadota bacterium]
MMPTRASLLLPIVMVVLAACGGDHPMSTLDAHSDLTREINHIYGRIFWWTGLLFLLVQGGLIYTVLRFRAKGNETTNPEQVHGNLKLELTWTILPIFILLHIAIPTVSVIFKSQAPATEEGKVTINALGEQWWFAFEYPELGVVTANEMHVPLGKEVEIRLQSDNVIHSFWVPQLAAKRDMVPGRVNQIKFKAEKLGEFYGQCAEYCGDSHALMKLRVVVDTPEDFAKWVEAQKAPAESESATAQAGFQAFQGAGCVACHAINGTTAAAVIGPDLTHVGSRTTIASGILENTEENLKTWIKDPPGVKPGSKMPNLNLSDEQVASIAAYLQTLK